jgi:hypothetical protein
MTRLLNTNGAKTAFFDIEAKKGSVEAHFGHAHRNN